MLLPTDDDNDVYLFAYEEDVAIKSNGVPLPPDAHLQLFLFTNLEGHPL